MSTPNIIYKNECNFLFLNFRIIGLRNCSAASFFDMFSFSISLAEADLCCGEEDFSSKNL